MKKSLKQSLLVFSKIFNEKGIEQVAERIDRDREGTSDMRKKIHGLHHRLQEKVDDPACENKRLDAIVEKAHKDLDEMLKTEE